MSRIDAPTPALTPLELEAAKFGSTFRKYASIARVSLVERMTYRADFLLSTFFRFLPMMTTVLLWSAVYDGSGQKRLGDSRTGIMFSYNEMIAYLLLVQISRMFSSMPGLAGGIAREIREGTLKRYLVQPLDMIGYLLAFRISHKVAYVIGAALPYSVLFFICRGFFDHMPPLWVWPVYLLSLVLAFLIGFFFEVCVGLAGFWLLEITSILYIVMTVNFFVSGHMLPLDMLPTFWGNLLKALPFSFMAYFPAAVFQGKAQGWDLAQGLIVGALWALFFMMLSRWLYRRGLNRYGAFGG